MNMLVKLMDSTSEQTVPSSLIKSTPVLDLGVQKSLEDVGTSTPVKTAEPTMKLTQETNKPCILFDLDGTLADPYHRRHYVRVKPKNWVAFFKAQVDDAVIEPIAHILRGCFESYRDKYSIVIFTARPDNYRGDTEAWLKKHNLNYDAIYMREAKDNRDDSITKKEMLDKLRQDGYNPIAVFDDRPKVIRMWQREGILCFPVADLNEEF